MIRLHHIVESVKVLRSGGIVLYPTDTLYALAVDARNPEAIRKLKKLKGRDEGKPISIVVADMIMAAAYGDVNEAARKLADQFLPGALTIVLDKKDTVLDELAGGGQTIAIRIPDSPFCLALARALGGAYTATSANVSGEETRRTVSDILGQFGNHAPLVDYVIDIGELPARKASTIVDVHDGEMKIIREGVISSKEIMKALSR